MATWPTGLIIDWPTLTETHSPVVERGEMDRGIPKQRRVVSDAMVQLKFSVVFDSRAKLTAFETWFYDAINGGQDFFDMLHPRTRASIQARFVNGQMGTIKPMSGGFDWSALDVTLEYWRSTW